MRFPRATRLPGCLRKPARALRFYAAPVLYRRALIPREHGFLGRRAVEYETSEGSFLPSNLHPDARSTSSSEISLGVPEFPRKDRQNDWHPRNALLLRNVVPEEAHLAPTPRS